MTAAQLHSVGDPPDDVYEAGLWVRDDEGIDATHFSVSSDVDETDVHFHAHFSGHGPASASIYQRLSAAEARELALGLERAADAAERSERGTGS